MNIIYWEKRRKTRKSDMTESLVSKGERFSVKILISD